MIQCTPEIITSKIIDSLNIYKKFILTEHSTSLGNTLWARYLLKQQIIFAHSKNTDLSNRPFPVHTDPELSVLYHEDFRQYLKSIL